MVTEMKLTIFSWLTIPLMASLLFSPKAITDTIDYVYDQAGRLVSANYDNLVILYQYDNAGNLLQIKYRPVLSTSQQLQQLYVAYLGRPADSLGLAYWTEQIELGNISLDQIRVNIVNEQPEYLQNYGQLSYTELTDRVYQNLFNREAEQAGRDYWIEQLVLGNVAPDQLIIAFVNGALTIDSIILANKLFISECFTSNEQAYTPESISALLVAADSDAILSTCPV
jgi:Domain of unknown function (DUF4214)/RHS Repeat